MFVNIVFAVCMLVGGDVSEKAASVSLESLIDTDMTYHFSVDVPLRI